MYHNATWNWKKIH